MNLAASSRRIASAPRRSHGNGGASQHPLSKKQKGIICRIAARAFEHRGATGDAKEWRREQQHAAVGVGSLTDCTQEHYNDLVAHFEGLAGEAGRQFNATLRQEDEELRQKRHNLAVALEERGLDASYAESICRDQYKCGLEKATAGQLFNLLKTVKSRRSVVGKPAAVVGDEDFPF